ncbi:MAG: DUF4199 domain-containing protein [bacterium]
MEEKTRTTTVHSLYYGLMTGAALIILSLILYISNLYMNRPLGYLSFAILAGGMVWGTLEYRKTYRNNFMTYGQAFSLCFLIGLFTAVVSAIFSYIFAEFIYPGLSQEILQKAREEIENGGQQITEEQMEVALDWTRKFTTPVMMAIMDLVMKVFSSVILALLAALFLKREDKSLNTTV